MAKVLLILLQLAGALTLLPFPAILLANVMGLAAPGGNPLTALLYIGLTLYPLLWLALWIGSWLAISKGWNGAAYGMSSIPVLVGIVFAGFMANSSFKAMNMGKDQAEGVRKEVEGKNSLSWTIYQTSSHGWNDAPTKTSAEALAAIEKNPGLVNVAVPKYGTPLRVAVETLAIDMQGKSFAWEKDNDGKFQIIRALVAKGAQLGADERTNLRWAWKVRMALHEGPVTTEQENPLVWRIVTRERGKGLFTLLPEEKEWLNKPTRLHGTPLYAALLVDSPDALRVLIPAGARLSEEEERDPAAQAELAKVFQREEDLKYSYKR